MYSYILLPRAYRELERACNSFNGEIISVAIYSNTKHRVYFPSKLEVQVLVLLFLVTLYFAVYTITMEVACPLSL